MTMDLQMGQTAQKSKWIFLGKIGGDYMAKPKENSFIIETYDEEKDMRVQFNY